MNVDLKEELREYDEEPVGVGSLSKASDEGLKEDALEVGEGCKVKGG